MGHIFVLCKLKMSATGELRTTLDKFNKLCDKKEHHQDELKMVNDAMKRTQPPLVDFLVRQGKKGFNVDKNQAELKLRSRTSKRTVNKKHAKERLSILFAAWQNQEMLQFKKTKDDDEVDASEPIEGMATEAVETIWSDLVMDDAVTTYWFEKKRKKPSGDEEELQLNEQ